MPSSYRAPLKAVNRILEQFMINGQTESEEQYKTLLPA